MADRVITRLQKKVSQLQREMEKMSSKVDGLTDQLRGEFQAEILKGFKVLRLEMIKMNQKATDERAEVVPVDQVKDKTGSLGVVTPSILGKSPVRQDPSHFNFSTKASKLNPRRSKLECPRFDGFDFLGWKLKVEQYFETVQLAEEEKVSTVMIHLDKKALQWHQRFMKSQGAVQNVHWSRYIMEMRTRFCNLEYVDPMLELVSLKQTNSVKEYYEEFESLLNLLNLSYDYALSVFIDNLKSDISKSVRLFFPKTLNHALNLAKQMEAVMHNLPKKPFNLYKYPTPNQNYSPSPISLNESTYTYNQKLPPLLPTPRMNSNPYTNTTNTNPKPPFIKTENPNYNKNLTREERDERRKNGLCMWCGVKYIRDHNCVRSKLYQLLVEETGEKKAEFEEFTDCLKTMETNGEDAGTLHAISLHTLVGTEDHHAMRLQG